MYQCRVKHGDCDIALAEQHADLSATQNEAFRTTMHQPLSNALICSSALLEHNALAQLVVYDSMREATIALVWQHG